jgi:hypothetical protein
MVSRQEESALIRIQVASMYPKPERALNRVTCDLSMEEHLQVAPTQNRIPCEIGKVDKAHGFVCGATYWHFGTIMRFEHQGTTTTKEERTRTSTRRTTIVGSAHWTPHPRCPPRIIVSSYEFRHCDDIGFWPASLTITSLKDPRIP